MNRAVRIVFVYKTVRIKQYKPERIIGIACRVGGAIGFVKNYFTIRFINDKLAVICDFMQIICGISVGVGNAYSLSLRIIEHFTNGIIQWIRDFGQQSVGVNEFIDDSPVRLALICKIAVAVICIRENASGRVCNTGYLVVVIGYCVNTPYAVGYSDGQMRGIQPDRYCIAACVLNTGEIIVFVGVFNSVLGC